MVLQEAAGIGEPLPPRPGILGIDFIEFAVSTEEAPALCTLFACLGFQSVGEHRSKNVSLWRQGGVHLIVNEEATGWAHSHRQIHGPSVCALALRVEDVAAALKRAEALNMASFRQRMAEGELAIPWIRGVGGALTYFTEPDRGRGHWTHDFLPVAETTATPERTLGIERLDHFTQTMRMEEFLSWQLYYTSLFALSKSPPIEVADTLGLVHSQAIESPDGTFRVILNGSSARQTLAARFIEGEMGAGVQHIALLTHDVFAAARAASDLGLAILPVPPNYYDDVRARFGLSAAFTEELRGWNMFFDRDDAGDYFHFYTRAFDKRFFFEIVERRGYRGFAAADTPVRLAAQARYRQRRFD
jgi:4-hydroxyphenylpyruvate dioxygenase